MARQTVEDAGRHLHAGSIQRRVSFIPKWTGTERVGGVQVAWEVVRNPLRLMVAHAEGGERYAVPILTSRLPTGGPRWWFGCPSCERRCDLLFLPPDAAQLSCRTCCKLSYRSQQSRRVRRERKRRTRSKVSITVTRRETWWGHIQILTRTRQMNYRA